jgi:hypothetical protein
LISLFGALHFSASKIGRPSLTRGPTGELMPTPTSSGRYALLRISSAGYIKTKVPIPNHITTTQQTRKMVFSAKVGARFGYLLCGLQCFGGLDSVISTPATHRKSNLSTQSVQTLKSTSYFISFTLIRFSPVLSLN